MNSDQPLIVTGMHRSGTSLVARFIHHSGIDLGDEFVGANKSNPYGHFEDIEIVEFQRSIMLRECGHSMWVSHLPRFTDADRTRARGMISARQKKPYWGWKEPRTCLFLDFWNDLLPDAYYLFVFRHPLLVLDSLSRRNKTRFYHLGKHNRFVHSWMLYNEECFRFHEQHRSRCILAMLELVLQTPENFVDLLSKRLRIEFDVGVFRALYDPTALVHRPNRRLLVSPSLRLRSLSLYDQLAITSQE